jgi:hypothetical protein
MKLAKHKHFFTETSLEGCGAHGEAVYAGPSLRFLGAQEINKEEGK